MIGFCAGFTGAVILCGLVPISWPLEICTLVAALGLTARGAAPWWGGVALGLAAWQLALNDHLLARDALMSRPLRQLEGVIADFPQCREDYCQFDLRLLRPAEFAGRVRVSWSQPAQLPTPGQKCRFSLDLKAIWRLHNRGGADSEGRAFARRQLARGRVLGGYCETGAGHVGAVDRWRGRLVAKLHAAGGPQTDRYAPALVAGDRRALDHADWDRLRLTGTSHLLAISGMHVTLVAALGMLAGRVLFFLWPQTQVTRFDLQGMLAVLAAGSYGLLAGGSISTQRALVMLCAPLLAWALRRSLSPWPALLQALFAVLLIDPAAVLLAGTWLSFAAVALLFALFVERPRGSKAVGLWRLQWALLAGLAPVAASVGLDASVVGPLANLLAVPWVTMVILPLTLICTGLLATDLPATWPLAALENQLAALVAMLDWLAQLQWPQWPVGASPAARGVALVAAFLVITPAGWPTRGLALLALTAAAHWPAPRPAPGQAWIDVLDVGQGTAVLVHTATSTTLIDTGPGQPNGWNAGRYVIAPTLRRLGAYQLDQIVVSHSDADHSGGLAGVVAALASGARVMGSSQTRRWPACLAGQRWRRDDVDFLLLHPGAFLPYLGNDSSCVLRISGRHFGLLLPGDISHRAERRIAPLLSHTEVLVLPHHGSQTGTSRTLLDAVTPHLGIATAGYDNRFGMPHRAVRDRLSARRIPLLESAECGALRLVSGPAGLRVARAQRRDTQAPWQLPGLCPKTQGQ